MPGKSKKGGGLEVGSAYKMKYQRNNSAFPFKSPLTQSYPSSSQIGPHGPRGTLDVVKKIGEGASKAAKWVKGLTLPGIAAHIGSAYTEGKKTEFKHETYKGNPMEKGKEISRKKGGWHARKK